jgi:hypothetical protein
MTPRGTRISPTTTAKSILQHAITRSCQAKSGGYIDPSTHRDWTASCISGARRTIVDAFRTPVPQPLHHRRPYTLDRVLSDREQMLHQQDGTGQAGSPQCLQLKRGEIRLCGRQQHPIDGPSGDYRCLRNALRRFTDGLCNAFATLLWDSRRATVGADTSCFLMR